MKEALLYQKLDENKVRCNLCAHRCVIPSGNDGKWHSQRNNIKEEHCPNCRAQIAGVGLLRI